MESIQQTMSNTFDKMTGNKKYLVLLVVVILLIIYNMYYLLMNIFNKIYTKFSTIGSAISN